MLGVPLNKRVRRVLAVSVADDLAVSIDETPGAYFPAGLQPPQFDNNTGDGSPRTVLAPWRLYWSRVPARLGPCDRVEVPGDATYELLAAPKPVLAGRSRVGFSAPVLPVEQLYPRSAELRALGADEPIATVECAVFQSREIHGQRTTSEDAFCELPPSAWQHIDRKETQRLVFGPNREAKISEAALGTEVPFITATLRGGV